MRKMTMAMGEAAMMKAHYCMMAGYNTWANQRLYDVAATLSDADYRRDCGAFSNHCTAP